MNLVLVMVGLGYVAATWLVDRISKKVYWREEVIVKHDAGYTVRFLVGEDHIWTDELADGLEEWWAKAYVDIDGQDHRLPIERMSGVKWRAGA